MRIAITEHAKLRAAQRSIPLSHIDLLLLVGTKVDDGYFVRDNECDLLECELRDILKKLRKWRGARLVVQNGAVVTIYKPSRRQERNLLRERNEPYQ